MPFLMPILLLVLGSKMLPFTLGYFMFLVEKLADQNLCEMAKKMRTALPLKNQQMQISALTRTWPAPLPANTKFKCYTVYNIQETSRERATWQVDENGATLSFESVFI